MARIRKIRVTQDKVRKIAKRQSIARVGATANPKGRANSYQHEGYRGVMYIARNMMKAEDKLLRTPGRHNVHQWSNAKQARGHVYVLEGRKRR